MPIATKGRVRPSNHASPEREPAKDHRKWIRRQVCAGCGKPAGYGDPIEAAHVRVGMSAGIAQKPPDWRLVPLHKTCHRESHVVGETRWWREHGIDDPVALALGYARRSSDPRIREAAT